MQPDISVLDPCYRLPYADVNAEHARVIAEGVWISPLHLLPPIPDLGDAWVIWNYSGSYQIELVERPGGRIVAMIGEPSSVESGRCIRAFDCVHDSLAETQACMLRFMHTGHTCRCCAEVI